MKKVADYFEFLRGFVHKAFSFETGVSVEGLEMDAWAKVTQRLGEVPAIETRWLKHLVTVVGGVNGYLRNLEQWQKHQDNISSNLRLTEEQRHQVVFHAEKIMPFLEGQDFDLEYLHWVVSDAITELTILIDQAEEFALELPSVLLGIRELECEHLRVGIAIIEGFSEEFRKSFYRRLTQTLTKAYASQNPQHIIQSIVEYFEFFRGIRTSQSFFIDADDALVGFHPQELKQRINMFETVEEWKKGIEKLVSLRAKIYTQFIKHEFTIISAVLPKEQNRIQWLREFFTHSERKATTFFPPTCDVDLLQMAIVQSLEQLFEVKEQVVLAQSILKNKTLLLVLDYLHSPPLRKFLDAELKRIEVFDEYSVKFERRLEAIQNYIRDAST